MGELGLMGVMVPEKYGGSGLDMTAFTTAIIELGRADASVAITMAAHNSLGIMPLLLFGSEEQKKSYLPKLASGKTLGAFGLTEPDAGSDAGSTKTKAVKSGDEYIVNGGKIFMASPINPKDLLSKVITKEIVKWDTDHGGLIAREEMRIGSIVLKSTPIQNPNPEKLIEAITDAIAEKGRQLLDWNKEVIQLLYRVNSLRKWNSSLRFPEYSMEALLASNKEWIIPYLSNVKKPQDLRKIDLKEILFYCLTLEQQKNIDALAPPKVKLSNGSFAKLEYQENCSEPVLAIPLQRCFGMLETPKVNGGKVNSSFSYPNSSIIFSKIIW